MMDTQHKALSWVSAACLRRGFLLSLAGHYMNYSGGKFCRYLVSLLWADGFYLRNALLTLVKNTLYTRTICGLGLSPAIR